MNRAIAYLPVFLCILPWAARADLDPQCIAACVAKTEFYIDTACPRDDSYSQCVANYESKEKQCESSCTRL